MSACQTLIRHIAPFFIVEVVVLVIITAFPWTVTGLPNLLGY